MPRLFDYWEKGEPFELWTRRLRLDALFALVFFVVMCDRFTENPIHETLGTVIGSLRSFMRFSTDAGTSVAGKSSRDARRAARPGRCGTS